LEDPVIGAGDVVSSADGLYLLILGKDEHRCSADQWLCLVLGDFYDGVGAEPHEPGKLDVFSIRVDMTWQVVS
jgi:hypothetical protein